MNNATQNTWRPKAAVRKKKLPAVMKLSFEGCGAVAHYPWDLSTILLTSKNSHSIELGGCSHELASSCECCCEQPCAHSRVLASSPSTYSGCLRVLAATVHVLQTHGLEKKNARECPSMDSGCTYSGIRVRQPVYGLGLLVSTR